jgi:hypothetical protein
MSLSATMGTDSDPSASTGRTNGINLTANNLTIDAGIVKGIEAGTASLGDKIFVDINGDGMQDATELGVQGVLVQLYMDANKNGLIDGAEFIPVKSQLSNALGEYMFTGLAAGTYQVAFSNLPSGYSLSPKDIGDDKLDSDGNGLNLSVAGNQANGGKSYTGLINLAIGEDNPTIDLGIVPPANTNCLGDYVWFDANNDGLQDAGEIGMPGVQVQVLNAQGLVVATTTTNEQGLYQVCGLINGSYSVRFSNLPPGFGFTSKSPTNTPNGSDADSTGKTVSVVLNSGNPNDKSLDAGLVSTRAALGNYVWYDNNKNGIQDASELPVMGATVSLYRPGIGLDGLSGTADDNAVVSSAITNDNGFYLFSNLQAGDYYISVGTLPSGYKFTQQVNVGDNQDNTNSDIVEATGNSQLVNLSASETDLSVDAGLVQIGTASVGDYVWFDNLRNGLQDASEPGAAGVLAVLYNSANQPIGSAVTNGSGKYLISDVPPGVGYYVKFSSNISSFGTAGRQTWTIANAGTTGAGAGTPGESNTDSDVSPTAGATFGNTGSFNVNEGDAIRNVDAGIRTPITLIGNVWHDVNGNTDGFVNNSGGAIGASPIPVGLRAYLVNPANNQIVKLALVSSLTGMYNMGEIEPSTNYYIILSSTAAVVGSPVPAAALPLGWVNTGEKLGITSGSDGVINGRLNIPGSIVSIINANFGIRVKNGEAVIP